MEIEYKNKSIEKICTDVPTAVRKYGDEMAEKINQRLDEIRSAESVEIMLQYHIGRCHPLEGDRKGQYAVDLVHPQRLIFTKKKTEVQIACIQDITDYHH